MMVFSPIDDHDFEVEFECEAVKEVAVVAEHSGDNFKF